MNIRKITIEAGRTFNHPLESFSNLRPSVTLSADLVDGEDAKTATKALQAMAEELVEDHKHLLLDHIRQLHELTEARAQAVSLETELARAQRKLEELRSAYPDAFPQHCLTGGAQ
jgi:hypothetical protein